MADEKDRRKPVERRPQQRPKRVHADTTSKCELQELEDEEPNVSLESLREKMLGLRSMHKHLRQTLSKPEKLHGEKLQQEFEDARSNEGADLPDSAWTDALLEALFEQAHENENGTSTGRTLYHIGQKTIFVLSGGRVGIQFDPTYLGETQESFYCVLSAKQPPAEKIYMSKDNLPFFLPVRELEKVYLSTSAAKFIDKVGEHLQAFVGRRGQMVKLQEIHGAVLEDFYHSLPYNLIHFKLEELNAKVGVSISYDKLELDDPTRCSVTAWFLYPGPASRRTTARRGTRAYQPPQVAPRSLRKAEEVIMCRSFPEAFEELVKEIRQALLEETNQNAVCLLE